MFGFLNLFSKNTMVNSEISKPLTQKIYKSFIVLYTASFSIGKKIFVEKYQGIVQNLNLWYLKLKTKNSTVYMPTSFIYDKIIEIYE